MSSRAPLQRHVQRLHTAGEIEADTDRCLVCGAVAKGCYSLDYAQGASTIDLSVPLPDVPLCATCVAAQQRAMSEGNGAIITSLFVPPVLVVLATILTPLGTPVVLLVIAVAAMLALRTFVGLVARKRAVASRILFLDGAGDDVLLQLRVEGEATQLPTTGYRELAHERPLAVEEKDAKPRGPKVKATIGLVLSALATALATLVGWFGAYPIVVFDNPTMETANVTIDGVRRLQVPPGGKATMPLPYGAHRVSLSAARGESTYDVDLRFGRNTLVSVDEAQCYQVTYRPVGKASSWEQTIRGPRVSIDDPNDVTRATCPKPYRLW